MGGEKARGSTGDVGKGNEWCDCAAVLGVSIIFLVWNFHDFMVLAFSSSFLFSRESWKLIRESPRLEKAFKHHAVQLSTYHQYLPAKPCPSVQHLSVSSALSGRVAQPPLWAACYSSSLLLVMIWLWAVLLKAPHLLVAAQELWAWAVTRDELVSGAFLEDVGSALLWDPKKP